MAKNRDKKKGRKKPQMKAAAPVKSGKKKPGKGKHAHKKVAAIIDSHDQSKMAAARDELNVAIAALSLSKPLTVLGLKPRIMAIFSKLGVETIGQLLAFPDETWRRHGIGYVALRDIDRALHPLGLELDHQPASGYYFTGPLSTLDDLSVIVPRVIWSGGGSMIRCVELQKRFGVVTVTDLLALDDQTIRVSLPDDAESAIFVDAVGELRGAQRRLEASAD